MDRSFCRLMLAACLVSSAFGGKVDFHKEIMPIFEDRCVKCHGPEKQKSEFRLDQRAVMLKGGDSGLPAIVPGDPKKSFLVEVISDEDSDMAMPPKGDPLTTEQIALISKWIEEGAEWPGQMDAVVEDSRTDHWSFQPVVRPEVPEGAKNPIDGFLNDALKGAGLSPNNEAEPRELIRRASIVLTGLPPKAEEVVAFEEASSVNAEKAYGELVDRLMASLHFGERWAQHWLDVIRWAETNGSESNLYRKGAWIYRDYVVRAFNNDVPYDQFITEQLAGDQLGVGEATGFLVAGPHVPAATVGREPAAIRQARADRMDEIMQTVGASMLGVTVSCARCHNHKFDPISIQDYYSLTAVFQGVEFGGRYPEFAQDHPRRKRADEVYPLLNAERKTLREELGFWEENWGGYNDMVFPGTMTTALRVEFGAPKVFIDEVEVFGPEDHRENLALASKGTKLVEDPEMVTKGSTVKKANDGEYGTMIWKGFAPKGSNKKPWVEINFKEAREVNRFRFSSNREYYFETDYLTTGPNGKFPAFRILAKQEDGSWQELASSMKARNALKKNGVAKTALQRLHQHIESLAEEGPQHSFIGRFKNPGVTKVLHRGSPESARDEVPPAGFEILNGDLGLDSSSPDPKRRLAFAKWLGDPTNPLTSRVMMNRIWHHLFGAGIVTTGSDFGLAGAPPTHPELLDWLASEFVKEKWSMKSMIRLLVMSDAFKRSSLPESRAMEKDAGSTLLWRYPPRRVEAEVIRDGILQASGKLDRSIGGRSYRIHNVKKTYAQWEVENNHGSETWRRLLYQERMRRVDDRIFTAFDFPDCGQVRAKRPVSTTPLQALNLLNSDFVVEQSTYVAERATKEAGGDPKKAVQRAFALVLGREPNADELKAGLEISKSNSLAIVCRSLINSNEFAYLP
ncbi:PSD1 and planctomycete cytochrome C domain-containing protein [Akkermansiaceae bacterium]|nr:PSD1 and planctomycete cytochrome C domain-containing protein [Akkermansiaceae bacterium]